MKKSDLIKLTIIFVTFTSLFMINSFNLIDYSRAAPNGNSLLIENNNIQMREDSKHQGKIENISSININLPSSNWNVSAIELNFTDIKIERQLKTVEDQKGTEDSIFYANPNSYQNALYVQLDITEQTTIYGVFIYVNARKSFENITFQIKGFDKGTLEPNSSIWGSRDLNISEYSSSGWYLQDFSSDPITLPIGTYSLVINGTERNYITGDGYFLDWTHNGAYPPLTPNLQSGAHRKTPTTLSWTKNVNRTFLYKLLQKPNRTINPEEINMTANFAGDIYKITDKLDPIGGNVSIICNEMLFSNLLEIQIDNNQSMILNFTVDYSISLQKITMLESSLKVQEYFNNSWKIEFNINKNNYNYYQIEINFSIFNWNNITIYEGGVNVTSSSMLDETNKIIILSNNTIEDGLTNWRITANSPKIEFQLDFPSSLLTIERGQNLRFTVNAPKGNLTFSLVDKNGYEDFRDEEELLSGGDYIFGHPIPSNAIAGLWKIYIFWNNNTDAGVLSQEFTVSVPFTIDPQILIITLIIIGILLIVGVSTYQTVKITKKYYDEKKRRVLNTVTDILNIKYFMITEKNSGLNIYEQKIGKGKQDSMLISGYLDAISKFEIALTDSEHRSQSIKLEYQDSKILMSEFKSFRIILIMKQNPSKYILNSIEKLSYDIDNVYGDFFRNFTGEIRNFRGLDNLIEKYLHISLIYPHKISYKNIEELSKAERKMIKRATDIIKTTPHFYILFLIPENEWKYRNFKTILKLIEKKVFQPIKPESDYKN